MYQPCPLKDVDIDFRRGDCAERYEVIRQHCDAEGKTVVDFGCANGYFPFRFLLEGAKSVRGVEIDDDSIRFIREHAEGFDFKVTKELPSGSFDIGLYLDLVFHFPESEEILEKMLNACSVLFVSPSGNGNNERLEKLLPNFEVIYEGYEGRKIYKSFGGGA